MQTIEKREVNRSAQNFAGIEFFKKCVASHLIKEARWLGSDYIDSQRKFRVHSNGSASSQREGMALVYANLQICSRP